MWAIESSNTFKGYFHILGGTLNANENYEQKDLLIDSLVRRIKKNNLKEVIIATSATVEGQTTATTTGILNDLHLRKQAANLRFYPWALLAISGLALAIYQIKKA